MLRQRTELRRGTNTRLPGGLITLDNYIRFIRSTKNPTAVIPSGSGGSINVTPFGSFKKSIKLYESFDSDRGGWTTYEEGRGDGSTSGIPHWPMDIVSGELWNYWHKTSDTGDAGYINIRKSRSFENYNLTNQALDVTMEFLALGNTEAEIGLSYPQLLFGCGDVPSNGGGDGVGMRVENGYLWYAGGWRGWLFGRANGVSSPQVTLAGGYFNSYRKLRMVVTKKNVFVKVWATTDIEPVAWNVDYPITYTGIGKTMNIYWSNAVRDDADAYYMIKYINIDKVQVKM